jgi:site-specific DNA-methyltransferase (cytosine-N4-specific)
MIMTQEPISPPKRATEWDFLRADTQYLTHNYHPFAAKFIPQIPGRLIREHTSRGDRVLDPFVGCGTTLVECKLSGRHAVGVDINPLFTLISKVKTTSISNEKLNLLPAWLDHVAKQVSAVHGQTRLFERTSRPTVNVPKFHNIDWWFSRHVQQELAVIADNIEREDDADLRDFLKVCLSSIIVRVSNQDSETRYARAKKLVRPFETLETFREKLSDMAARMREFSSRCTDSTIELYIHDSRHLEFLAEKSFDLIITSPPYMNAYDYHKYHRQRMNWLGIDPQPVRRAEIGGHDTYTKRTADPETYFGDMCRCIGEMYRVLRRKKFCFIVIGDAIVKGKEIASHKRFGEIGEEVGFRLHEIVTRNVDKTSKSFGYGARIEKEHIVGLEKL